MYTSMDLHSFLNMKVRGEKIRCYYIIADAGNRMIVLRCSISLLNNVVIKRDLRCHFLNIFM
jgi:hypothetical protein